MRELALGNPGWLRSETQQPTGPGCGPATSMSTPDDGLRAGTGHRQPNAYGRGNDHSHWWEPEFQPDRHNRNALQEQAEGGKDCHRDTLFPIRELYDPQGRPRDQQDLPGCQWAYHGHNSK